MIRYKLIFFFSVILCTSINAQDSNIWNHIFVSSETVYYFNKFDSTFYSYPNNKYIVYASSTGTKAQFEISNNGFGYVKLVSETYTTDGKLVNQKYDSIYVSVTPYDEKYIIDYYLIKNNQKTLPSDDSVAGNGLFDFLSNVPAHPELKSDTVSEYFTVLSTNSYPFPFVDIHNVIRQNSFIYLHDNKLTWGINDKKFFIDISFENQSKINLLLNEFVLKNLQNPKEANFRNLYKCDLKYLEFRTNGEEIKQLINEFRKIGTTINEVIPASINFTDNAFNKLIKSVIFYSYQGGIGFFSKNSRTLYGSKQINNIYEITDNLINYFVYNSDSTKVDTFNVSYSCLSKNIYLLKYNQFKDEEDFDMLGFTIKAIKEDTIMPINKAIENNLLTIDRIEITDIVNNRNLIKVNVAENTYFINDNLVNCNELEWNLIQNKINMFVSKNILMKVDNYSYEVKIGWKESGANNVKFHCTEKEANKFVKSISTIINASR